MLHPYIYIHIYFLNDIRNSHLRLPSGRCDLWRTCAYRQVQILLTSSSMYVMRTLHLHGRSVKRAVHHRACTCTCNLLEPARGSVGGSAWRHYGGVQRSSTGVEMVRERRRYGKKGGDNAFEKDAAKPRRRRGEASISETFSLACAPSPLIKSLLNRITALPLARHVAVISKHRFLPSPRPPHADHENSRDKLYASLRLHRPRFHDRI